MHKAASRTARRCLGMRPEDSVPAHAQILRTPTRKNCAPILNYCAGLAHFLSVACPQYIEQSRVAGNPSIPKDIPKMENS